MFRIAKLVLLVATVLASLIVFPSGVSLLALAWVMAALICLSTKKDTPAGLCLALLAVILILKTPSTSIAFFALLVVIATTAAICCFSTKSWAHWTAILASLAMAVGFGVDRWYESTASQPWSLAEDRPIVCIGDSLTEGVKGGFPGELQKLVSPPVINLGRNGYTTQLAIDDLLPQLKQIAPQLVVVELGGHDYNTGQSRADTKRKLQHIVREIQALGAVVVLVEIPRGIIQDPFYGLDRELAREFDLQLVPDTIVRQCFFFSPIIPPGAWLDSQFHLSDDGLHPNVNGQVEFAKAVAAAIKQ